jgi:hypothetical protein
MTTEQQVDYSSVLADMEARRAGLDAAIAGMKLYLNGQSGGPSAGESSPGAVPGEIPTGAFHGKSIPEAANLCLQIMKRKLTTREISDALRKGGLESTSNNFQGIVHSVLNRNRKAGGEIVKMEGSYWGLAAWYPPGVRSAMMSQEKATTKKHKKAKRKPEKTAKPKPAVTDEPRKMAAEEKPAAMVEPEFKSGGTPYRRIVAFLAAYPLVAHSAEKVSAAVGLPLNVTKGLLGNAVQNKKAEKTPGGEFQLFTAKAQEMSLAS